MPSEGKEAIWFVVSRAARLHAGPSVSSGITHFYPVGSELNLVGYEQGWFLVSDPATLRQGWIYEKYYLEAIRGPGQMIAALQEPAKPQQKVVNARKPTPHVRRAKTLGPRPTKRIQPTVVSAARYRYETVASILDKALRR